MESIAIYAGVKQAGKMRIRALQKAAKRQKTSRAEIVWESLKKFGDDELRAALLEADRLER